MSSKINRLNDRYYLILSAATKGSRYVECVERQKEIYKDFNYLGLIMPDRGSWGENTKLKVDAVLNGFKYCKNVLWIDSDCEITPPDNLPEGDFDIGFVDNMHPTHKIKISAGFIFFRDTKNTRDFLDLWNHYNKNEPKDHPAFLKAIRRAKFLRLENITQWLGTHKINSLANDRGEYICEV